MKFGWEQKQGLNWRAIVVRQFVICCVLLFSFSQFAAAFHIHESAHQHEYEHEHEQPSHRTCDVCILAINDDADPEQLIDNDLDLVRVDVTGLALAENIAVTSFLYLSRTSGPYMPPDLRRNATRAPPVQI